VGGSLSWTTYNGVATVREVISRSMNDSEDSGFGLSTLNPGTSSAATSRTVQTPDTYFNLGPIRPAKPMKPLSQISQTSFTYRYSDLRSACPESPTTLVYLSYQQPCRRSKAS